MTITNDPPAPGTNNTIVIRYDDNYCTVEVAGLQMFTGSGPNGPTVYGTMVFHKNIRVGAPAHLPAFVRHVARHEGGHGVGLGNADNCPRGSTIMHLASEGETFITSCDNASVNANSAYPSPTPPEPSPEEDPTGCGKSCDWSPIVLDVAGNGFNLTDNVTGVAFDLDSDASPEQLSWTSGGSDDAWLALDRNGNGKIDNGREMFGNYTAQPEPPLGEDANGFLALTEYDKVQNGGNGDGEIDRGDAIFWSLRLWQDKNHNGVSEPWELHNPADLGVESISLDYRESRRRDRFGNVFRYRAKVYGTDHRNLGRWAYDVFLSNSR